MPLPDFINQLEIRMHVAYYIGVIYPPKPQFKKVRLINVRPVVDKPIVNRIHGFLHRLPRCRVVQPFSYALAHSRIYITLSFRIITSLSLAITDPTNHLM